MIIRRKPIHRRTLLKGMLGGAAVTVALPPLEAFLGQLTAARATESAYPTRFGIFSWGNGVHLSIGFQTISDLTGSQKNNSVPLKMCAKNSL